MHFSCRLKAIVKTIMAASSTPTPRAISSTPPNMAGGRAGFILGRKTLGEINGPCMQSAWQYSVMLVLWGSVLRNSLIVKRMRIHSLQQAWPIVKEASVFYFSFVAIPPDHQMSRARQTCGE